MDDKVNKFMDDFIDNNLSDNKLNDIDNEFIKYCKIYKEKFGKDAYICEPSGTKEQTINAIKICIEKNEDLLDELLNTISNNNLI